jgi:hypothetical protein
MKRKASERFDIAQWLEHGPSQFVGEVDLAGRAVVESNPNAVAREIVRVN